MRSRSFMRKRDRRKLAEEHSGQITEITGFHEKRLERFLATIFGHTEAGKPLYNRSGPVVTRTLTHFDSH